MHTIPEFSEYAGRGIGVSFVECQETALDQTVQRIYGELGGSAQDFSVLILSATRSGLGSSRHLNQLLHEQHRGTAEPVYRYDPQYGVVPAATVDRVPLKVGDLVVYTRNGDQIGVRDGSLGRITRAMPVTDAESTCCTLAIEDEHNEYTLKSEHIPALTHAYALTTNRSQGSVFPRIVVPIRRNRNLDQALLYTALTRGTNQAVLVGDPATLKAAILSPNSLHRRHVTLPIRLRTPHDFVHPIGAPAVLCSS